MYFWLYLVFVCINFPVFGHGIAVSVIMALAEGNIETEYKLSDTIHSD